MQSTIKQNFSRMICEVWQCIFIPLLFTTLYGASWAWLFWYVNEIGTKV